MSDNTNNKRPTPTDYGDYKKSRQYEMKKRLRQSENLEHNHRRDRYG